MRTMRMLFVLTVAGIGTFNGEASAQEAKLRQAPDAELRPAQDACRGELLAATIGGSTTTKYVPLTRQVDFHLGTPELKFDALGIKAKVPSITLFDARETTRFNGTRYEPAVRTTTWGPMKYTDVGMRGVCVSYADAVRRLMDEPLADASR